MPSASAPPEGKAASEDKHSAAFTNARDNLSEQADALASEIKGVAVHDAPGLVRRRGKGASGREDKRRQPFLHALERRSRLKSAVNPKT